MRGDRETQSVSRGGDGAPPSAHGEGQLATWSGMIAKDCARDTETIILSAVEGQRRAARELERLVALSQERNRLRRKEVQAKLEWPGTSSLNDAMSSWNGLVSYC